MTYLLPDQYILNVINKYKVQTGILSPARTVVTANIFPIIRKWASPYLLKIDFSGSFAKNTAIIGSTDIDIFISLSPNTPHTLKEIYDRLYIKFPQDFKPRKQNVSINIQYSGLSIDLIPAKKQNFISQYHSVFKNRENTWTQTNIHAHINTVNNSMRHNEIRALKIWRNINGLDFPSFYLEMTVLNALGRKSVLPMARTLLNNNIWKVFTYLKEEFVDASVIDPSNTNNAISDDLTIAEKEKIAASAEITLKKRYWEEIIW